MIAPEIDCRELFQNLRACDDPAIILSIEGKLRLKGRTHDALLVGANPLPSSGFDFNSWHPPAGVLAQYLPENEHDHAEWDWSEGQWFRCRKCQRICVYHSVQSFDGYPCGHYDGDGHLGQLNRDVIEALWADALNTVSVKPQCWTVYS